MQHCHLCFHAEREVKREMLSEAGGAIVIPDVTRFDSNIITPVSSPCLTGQCMCRLTRQ